MATRHTVAGFLLSALGISHSVLAGAPIACSGGLPLSCHNTTAQTNTCCFNTPGGSLLQTQFWDTSPAVGPTDSWTIHGLWPDHCDGTYDANCDDARAYANISDILTSSGNELLLDYMKTYWLPNSGPAESFWEHEWGKHGTCISTLEPKCFSDYQPTEEVPYFFQKTVNLFKTLPTYKWLEAAGITPSSQKTYTLDDIQSALSKNRGGETVYLGCTNGAIDQVYYYFNVKGSVISGDFLPASPDSGSLSSCPSTGIKYLPKSGGGGGDGATSKTTTITTTTATPTSSPPSGTGAPVANKGYLNVLVNGSKKGCIISPGTWYTSGTCATFTATGPSDSFTLKSSKGACGVSGGTLRCGSGLGPSARFGSSGSALTHNGSRDWYADNIPSGSKQSSVYTSRGTHTTEMEIQWQGM